jgi:hypothetical protein
LSLDAPLSRVAGSLTLAKSKSKSKSILCRLAGRDPMQLGAAILHVNWLDGRTLGDWHSG